MSCLTLTRHQTTAIASLAAADVALGREHGAATFVDVDDTDAAGSLPAASGGMKCPGAQGVEQGVSSPGLNGVGVVVIDESSRRPRHQLVAGDHQDDHKADDGEDEDGERCRNRGHDSPPLFPIPAKAMNAIDIRPVTMVMPNPRGGWTLEYRIFCDAAKATMASRSPHPSRCRTRRSRRDRSPARP